jgi:hypothetical protein
MFYDSQKVKTSMYFISRDATQQFKTYMFYDLQTIKTHMYFISIDVKH